MNALEATKTVLSSKEFFENFAFLDDRLVGALVHRHANAFVGAALYYAEKPIKKSIPLAFVPCAVRSLATSAVIELLRLETPHSIERKSLGPFFVEAKPLLKISNKASDYQPRISFVAKAYTDLIARFAQEVKSSRHAGRVIGVRLSYDAIGTEWMIIPPEDRDPKDWTVPNGVTLAPSWTEEIAADYRRTVQEAYLREFGPGIRVFLRSGVAAYPTPDLESIHTAEEGHGKLGFFTTGAEMEPGWPAMLERFQKVFLPFCRSGKVVCYSEQLAGAGGESVRTDGSGTTGRSPYKRWCGPEQWNYWRILSDLNLGFSMIALYGPDIERAGNRAAFDFAARYAGYHASPSVSPGAWVALREGSKFKGDYTFLMHRLAGPELHAEQGIGPNDQRFGAWALTLPKGTEVRFALDPTFARSLKKVTLRVTYLDRGDGTFSVLDHQTKLTGSARWKTAEFESTQPPAELGIVANTDLTLHMIEVAR